MEPEATTGRQEPTDVSKCYGTYKKGETTVHHDRCLPGRFKNFMKDDVGEGEERDIPEVGTEFECDHAVRLSTEGGDTVVATKFSGDVGNTVPVLRYHGTNVCQNQECCLGLPEGQKTTSKLYWGISKDNSSVLSNPIAKGCKSPFARPYTGLARDLHSGTSLSVITCTKDPRPVERDLGFGS